MSLIRYGRKVIRVDKCIKDLDGPSICRSLSKLDLLIGSNEVAVYRAKLGKCSEPEDY